MFAALTWKSVGSWIFKLLPIILIVGIVLYAVFVVIPDNKKLKDELQEAQRQYAELEERFDKYEENVERMNGNISGQITIRTQQTTVRDRMNDIDVATEDKPYLDDGLRTRAGVMRDYQKSSPVYSGS